ncbi:hypothetical protein GONAM_31_00030 [Gordonia namibiensis NBRC 108229]|uniref:Peptidase MA-like domain-containing protein n=1 Tax=Gordonia namibiensis NBRC 108229 TaxID=1208314 RepID=K6VZG1_9ACTN|nr:hypothetical protein [Gordonia namibiensis]GAC01659.1 hypothetical protein GONAM_31_00030 [Gordonia namibiensis NBRC 108229]
MVSLRGRWRPTLASAVVLLVGVTTGCGGQAPSTADGSTSGGTSTTTSTPANPYEQQRAEGVTRLLDDLTGTITSGDVPKIGSLLDDAATPAFRSRWVTAAENFRPRQSARGDSDGRLQFKSFRYQLAPTEEAETLVPADVQGRLDANGSSDAWVAPVELRYALGGERAPGVDEPEVVVTTQFVVARYGDAWKLVGDTAALGAEPTPTQLWELPGLSVSDVATAGGSSVITRYLRTSAAAANLPELLPDAVDAVTAFWGDSWDRRAVLVTTSDQDEFSDLVTQDGGAIGAAAAATVYSRVDFPRRTAIGQRVVFTPAADDLAPPTLDVVLRHELTHVAARAQTALDAPLWITEGVAEYVGRKGTYRRLADAAPDLTEVVRAGNTPTALPDDAAFAMDGQTSQLAYQSAWSMAAYIADRYDEARLKRFYLGVAATADPTRQDAAIRAALGVSRDELITGWGRWLDGQVG